MKRPICEFISLFLKRRINYNFFFEYVHVKIKKVKKKESKEYKEICQ